jgi:hypothetical protein
LSIPSTAGIYLGMSQAKKVALLLAVFFLGCAAERFIVPPARAGTSPQRWEYACQRATEDVTKMANAFGLQGWELTAAAGTAWGGALSHEETMLWCFKRPLP